MTETTMRAVVFDAARGGFAETSAPVPRPAGHDLLVKVRAVSLNPVDLKVRAMTAAGDPPRQLGYDACGIVAETGPDARGFAPGDRVFYAGAVQRPGSNATHHLVDARIVAHAPASLDDADAAALPLTALTAWEALFERLRLQPPGGARQPQSLLVINGAGGVGSLALQLARLAGIQATATASRPETRDWCHDMGAAKVIGHADLAGLPDNAFDRIFCCHDTGGYFAQMARLVAPQGLVCGIVGMPDPQSLMPMFQKSAGFVWEYMFTRAVFATPDMARQGQILAEVAQLVDAGSLRATRTRTLDGLSPDTLTEAHRLLAEGRMMGKLVIRF